MALAALRLLWPGPVAVAAYGFKPLGGVGAGAVCYGGSGAVLGCLRAFSCLLTAIINQTYQY